MKRVEGFPPYVFLIDRQPTPEAQYLRMMIERTSQSLRDARHERAEPYSRQRREFII